MHENRRLQGTARRDRRRTWIGIGLLALSPVAAGADDLFLRAQLVDTPRIVAVADANAAAAAEPRTGPQAIPAETIDAPPPVRSLRDVSLDIRVEGDAPADVAAPGTENGEVVVGNDLERGFGTTLYFWQASNMAHRPLWFEQRYVERYGANFGPLQPVASGVQFYGDVALLPVKMVRQPACKCVYSLGHGRPGDAGVRCPRH